MFEVMLPLVGSQSKDTPAKPSRKDASSNLTLTKIRQLLKDEFAFDGYMNQSQEDLDMGKVSSRVVVVLFY